MVPARADVAKSVDARHLKCLAFWACGFESRRPHHLPRIVASETGPLGGSDEIGILSPRAMC